VESPVLALDLDRRRLRVEQRCEVLGSTNTVAS
jgi:hypothetical protein